MKKLFLLLFLCVWACSLSADGRIINCPKIIEARMVMDVASGGGGAGGAAPDYGFVGNSTDGDGNSGELGWNVGYWDSWTCSDAGIVDELNIRGDSALCTNGCMKLYLFCDGDGDTCSGSGTWTLCSQTGCFSPTGLSREALDDEVTLVNGETYALVICAVDTSFQIETYGSGSIDTDTTNFTEEDGFCPNDVSTLQDDGNGQAEGLCIWADHSSDPRP